VEATFAPGLYRVDWVDAAFAANVDKVLLSVIATGCHPAHQEVQLVSYDPDDAVRLGLTALPNAAAEAAGGLYTRGTGAGQIAQDANGNVRVNVDTIKTQTLVCASLTTVAAFVGTAAANTAQTGDSFDRIGAGGSNLTTAVTRLGWVGQEGAVAGGAAGTLTLASGATTTNDVYNGATAVITSGVGNEQSRVITDYDGSTKIATVSPNWTVTPTTDSVYAIVATPPAPTATASLPAVNVAAWLGTAAATPAVAGRPSVDAIAISGDTTAADNCELMFDGTGYAGGTAKLKVDVETIKTQAVTCGAGVTVAAYVGTAAANTAQTGDSFARIGALGASLTGVPWNAAWDAQVESEVDDALKVLGLDHLVSAPVAGTDVADNSIAAKLVSKSATADWDDFVNTTDSLQAAADAAFDPTADEVNVGKINGTTVLGDGGLTPWGP
jgi:hypothetical protein